MRYRSNKYGFSLIEVNLAILLIAVGLLALFSLFPLGLKESERGLADTQEAMFADTVLSAMEGNALSMTNWADWEDLNQFRSKVKSGIHYSVQENGLTNTLTFPENTRYKIRYKLKIEGDGPRKSAMLYAMHGGFGDFGLASVYYTEFVYTGM